MKNNVSRVPKILVAAVAAANLILLFFLNRSQPPYTAVHQGTARGLGTCLSIPSEFPAVTDLELPNLGARLIEAGSIKATDAAGRDITDRITVETESNKNDERIALLTFSVQSDEDKEPVSISTNIPVTLNRPVIVLSSDYAALEQGSAFDPMAYVSEAVDASGQDILESTAVIGSVDTSTPGTYKITFQAKDANGYVSDPKTLNVSVG